MKQSLSLRVSQHLTLTPQLQQAIRLLQISTLELQQEVAQMLDENPFLEQSQEHALREEFGLEHADTPVSSADLAAQTAADFPAEDVRSSGEELLSLSDSGMDWEGDGSVQMSPDDSEWGGDAKARNGQDDGEDKEASELARMQESLQSHLRRQVLSLRLAAPEHAALHFLIDSLNEDGYLEDSLETLAGTLLDGGDALALEDLLHHFTVALGLLQHLEPAGVGARDLAECLRLQLQALQHAGVVPAEAAAFALRVCAQAMDLLARRDVKRLAQVCDGSEAQVREALALIARLEPKPGRRFADVQHHAVVPDVLVTLVQSSATATAQLKVQLNPDVMPRLRVQEMYANALRNHRSGTDAASHSALQQRLQEARWFIKNIQQRFDTILRVSKAIVQRQRAFFLHGDLAMQPLSLREIAQELNLHESTLSRVTSAKYMATPFGTFELKHFFGSGLGTDSGGNTSSTAVRALIKQLVGAENPKKPLSDAQIADLLKEQGIACARRTVAKYREALKIATASVRRQ